jgi:hypothetical protein
VIDSESSLPSSPMSSAHSSRMRLPKRPHRKSRSLLYRVPDFVNKNGKIGILRVSVYCRFQGGYERAAASGVCQLCILRGTLPRWPPVCHDALFAWCSPCPSLQ